MTVESFVPAATQITMTQAALSYLNKQIEQAG
jgi:DNA-binding transcriptional LysR family regulator